MNEATTTEPVATGMVVEATAPVATAGAGKTDDELKKFGAAIAVCALLLLFGGETFAMWNVEMEVGDTESTSNYGTNEFYFETDSDYIDDDNIEYGDSDCNCDEIEDFFAMFKILLYVLLLSGAALVYMGHTGEKMEFAPKVLAAAALVSVVILAYTFISLPKAYEEDYETFDRTFDKDPAFFSDNEEEVFGIETKMKTTASLGFFVPLLSLGAAGYLINDRGIKLEDITG